MMDAAANAFTVCGMHGIANSPSAAKRHAHASPIPELAPVIMTTLPLRDVRFEYLARGLASAMVESAARVGPGSVAAATARVRVRIRAADTFLNAATDTNLCAQWSSVASAREAHSLITVGRALQMRTRGRVGEKRACT